jgi:hydrogenase/urease accessory protein HupE
MRIRAGAWRVCAPAGALLSSAPAQAHAPMPGVEGFYLGLLHPASAPEPLLCVLAVGLVLGMAGPAIARRAWGLFVTALAPALIGSWVHETAAVPEWLPLAVALAAAASAVVGWVRWLSIALGAAGGAAIGLAAAPDPGPLAAGLITMAGTFVGANLLLLLAFGGVDVARERLRAVWFRLAARILAGWLVAIILLWGAFAYFR